MAATKQAARQRHDARQRASVTREVESQRRGSILVLTLARPDRRNSLSEAMLAGLHEGIDAAAPDEGVRAVVIAAKGNVFCAGHDLKEFTAHRGERDGGRAYHTKIMHQCSSLMRSIVRCPKPVIAAVQGTATAAGCQL